MHCSRLLRIFMPKNHAAMPGPKFDTCFFERYAMVTLRTVLGERYGRLVNDDRPDLQMPDRSMGIEVTRAMEESKSVADSLLLEMAGVIDPEDDEAEDSRRILESGYAYGLKGGRYVGKLEYRYWSLAQPLRRIIASKVDKVSSGFYGDFRHFGLYVFCKDHLTEEEVNLTVNYTSGLQSGKKVSYDMLYLSLIDSLYVCDMNSGAVSRHEISRDQCRTFFIESVSGSVSGSGRGGNGENVALLGGIS